VPGDANESLFLVAKGSFRAEVADSAAATSGGSKRKVVTPMLGVMDLLARRAFLEGSPSDVFLVANEDSAYFQIRLEDLSKIGAENLYHALAISWSRQRMRYASRPPT
jgi:CRP-like cAMP-binding protein